MKDKCIALKNALHQRDSTVANEFDSAHEFDSVKESLIKRIEPLFTGDDRSELAQ